MNWPKLPNRKSFLDKGYTAIQMREYAEKCVKIALLEAKNKEQALQALHSENERLDLYKDVYGSKEQA